MKPSTGRAYLIGGLLLLPWLLIGGGGPQGPAQGLSAHYPDQAILFDGSADGESTLLLAMSKEGFLIDLGEGGYTCPEGHAVAEGGLYTATLQEPGVLRLGPTFTEGLPLQRLVGPTEPPLDLDDLEGDCDIVDRFPDVEAYLDDVSAEAQDILSEVEACVQAARDLWCELIPLIEANPGGSSWGGCDKEGCTVLPPTDTMDNVPRAKEPQEYICNGLRSILRGFPQRLDSLRYEVTRCEYALGSLTHFRDEVLECIQMAGGVGTQCATGGATSRLSRAEEALVAAQTLFDVIHIELAHFTPEAAQESCDTCPGWGGEDPEAAQAVVIIQQKKKLGRLIGALQKAANAAWDDAESDALKDLAHRLSRVPNDRVLQAVYRTDSAVGQQMVAVRSPTAPDDGESPRVVVLTALHRDAPLPPPTVEDERILFDVLREFRDTLSRSDAVGIDR